MTQQTPDLEYYRVGNWTRFVPSSPSGEEAYLIMVNQLGGESVDILTIHESNVLKQLRNAGYKVSKLKSTTQSIDEILAELGV